ncbi:MAG: hypothetical protein K6L75_03310 [Cellvibrionaceae bacterium]|nr:hypothetical protein [Motiliproteus sp.]MCW9052146.1 hypothetical protein [Motiliproteus sp.]
MFIFIGFSMFLSKYCDISFGALLARYLPLDAAMQIYDARERCRPDPIPKIGSDYLDWGYVSKSFLEESVLPESRKELVGLLFPVGACVMKKDMLTIMRSVYDLDSVIDISEDFVRAFFSYVDGSFHEKMVLMKNKVKRKKLDHREVSYHIVVDYVLRRIDLNPEDYEYGYPYGTIPIMTRLIPDSEVTEDIKPHTLFSFSNEISHLRLIRT